MDNISRTLGFIIIVVQASITTGAFNSSVETSLRTSLLSLYSNGVRPDAVVDVGILFNIITINDLNIRSQSFSVSGWFIMKWTDDRLTWDTTVPIYSGTNFLFFTQTEVWKPTLIVENSLDDLSVIEDDNVPFRVFAIGTVFWNPPGIYVTYCNIDITYYPFDTQTCSITLKSVGYNIRELNLTVFSEGVKTSDYKENGEWVLLSATSTRTETTDSSVAETYSTLTVSFTVKRRTEYYGLNIILPVVVLALLSSLVFLLPLESGEKMGYSLTVLLAIAVFLTMIADQIPTTSKSISLLTIYITIVVVLSGLSVVASLFTLDTYFRDEKDKIPNWVRKITMNVLMPFACWKGCCKRCCPGKPNNKVSNNNALVFEGYKNKASYAFRDTTLRVDTASKSKPLEEDEEDELSWVVVAKVMDGCFLRIYVGMICIISAVILTIMMS